MSIIVPVYNTEKYLPAFLDCLLKTCTQKLELILVDDGSTDSSGLIADRYEADYPFIRVLHLNNSGPAAARNAGIVNAHTQYITFMDSDDYIDPEAFNRVLMRLDKIPAQLWVSDFHRVDDRGNILDRVYQIEETAEPITDAEYLTHFLTGRECVWNVWRYIYSRHFLTENGLLFDETAKIAEDLEFIVRVLGKVTAPVFYHNPYYFYRVNYSDTLTRRYTAERVRQFTKMIMAAERSLDSADKLYAKSMRDKLAREYSYNLAICKETAKDQQAIAMNYYRETWYILDDSSLALGRAVVLSEKLFGLSLTAGLMLTMKKLKRLGRTWKKAGHGR